MSDDKGLGRCAAGASPGHDPFGAQPATPSSCKHRTPNAGDAPRPSKAPCGSCPYRRDVPAGIWEAREYAKLPPYDRETWAQPPALFFCHQNDGHLCAGWVGCHDTRHLISMRFHRVHPDTFDYESPVPLFASGAEAAAHGMSGVNAPGQRARAAIEKLAKKLPASAASGRSPETAQQAQPEGRQSGDGEASATPNPSPVQS